MSFPYGALTTLGLSTRMDAMKITLESRVAGDVVETHDFPSYSSAVRYLEATSSDGYFHDVTAWLYDFITYEGEEIFPSVLLLDNDSAVDTWSVDL